MNLRRENFNRRSNNLFGHFILKYDNTNGLTSIGQRSVLVSLQFHDDIQCLRPRLRVLQIEILHGNHLFSSTFGTVFQFDGCLRLIVKDFRRSSYLRRK